MIELNVHQLMSNKNHHTYWDYIVQYFIKKKKYFVVLRIWLSSLSMKTLNQNVVKHTVIELCTLWCLKKYNCENIS